MTEGHNTHLLDSEISHNELHKKSQQEDIIIDIGHISHKDQYGITREEIFWSSDGKRKQGQLKIN